MTAIAATPDLSPVTAEAGISNFWTTLTVASLAKSVGELTARTKHDPVQYAAVREVEVKLEAFILTGAVGDHSVLMELTREVDYLKRG